MEHDNQNRKDEQQGKLNQYSNDTAPVEEMSTDISAVVSKATAYERALGILKDAIARVNHDRKEDSDDECYEIVMSYLNLCMAHCARECDALWQMIYRNAEFGDGNLEKLNSAVMLQAVHDYENALCKGGKTAKDTIEEIERFASTGTSHHYSAVDFGTILQRIKDTAPEFHKMVREHGAEIIADTLWLKRKKDYNFENAKYHCPLCGGGMYHYGKKIGNTYRIRCTGCSLEGWYHAKESY